MIGPGTVLTARSLHVADASTTYADVPNSCFSEPSLTATAVPFWIACASCISDPVMVTDFVAQDALSGSRLRTAVTVVGVWRTVGGLAIPVDRTVAMLWRTSRWL